MNRLTLRRNPVSLLLSPGPWAAAWYLFSYLFTGTILFTAVVAGTAIAVALSFTVVGLPLLIAAAAVIRAAAHVERVRTRVATGEPVRGRYREVTRAGLLARVATQWRDPAVWRDLAYLLGLYGPLLALDWAVFSVWLTLLAGVTVPAWYGRVTDACVGTCQSSAASGIQFGRFPHGPHGPGGWGLYVDTLPKALLIGAACLIVFLLFSYVLVATARLHASIARALLRAPEDPLGAAKEVLRRSGPLSRFMPGTFMPNGR
jgi:hypothetical protein